VTLDDYPYASPPGAKIWQSELLAARSDEPLVLGVAGKPLREPELGLPPLAVIAGVVVAIAAVGNGTMFPIAESIRPGGIGFIFGLSYLCFVAGSMGGQLAVLTVLLVWGAGPLWMRLVCHWGLALLAFSAWLFGFLVASMSRFGASGFPGEGLLAAVLGLPLIALASQLAPWLVKLYFQWRIELPDQTHETAAVHQLSIRDIFLGTILVAVTMAAVRVGKPANTEEGIYWAGWGIGSGAAAGISLLCLVPMVYLTLGAQRARWGAVGVVAIALSVAAIAAGSLMWFNPGGGPSDKEIILMMVSLAAGFTLTLCSTLWITRKYGYRLVIGASLMNPFGPR
jgi:hypothetical protein